MSCTEIQQRLAWGEALSAEQHAHATDCRRCLQVATEYSILDETLGGMPVGVPPEFADRVMTQVLGSIAVPHPQDRRQWQDKRWFQFALVYGGSVVAAINLVRFLAGVLTTSVGLGGVQ